MPLRAAIGLLAAPLPIIALAVAPAAHASVQPNVALRSDVLPVIAHATRTGQVAANKGISVTVSLAQRDPAGLQTFLKQVTDAKSSQYKHYLTVKQFADRFGA